MIAIEWNPASVEALKTNLELNKCQDRCLVLQGDNREVENLKRLLKHDYLVV